MFYYYWLIKKLFWPMARQNIAKREIQADREKEGGTGEDARTLSVSHGACGDVQIGLIYM